MFIRILRLRFRRKFLTTFEKSILKTSNELGTIPRTIITPKHPYTLYPYTPIPLYHLIPNLNVRKFHLKLRISEAHFGQVYFYKKQNV
jgi:hypothetical protein